MFYHILCIAFKFGSFFVKLAPTSGTNKVGTNLTKKNEIKKTHPLKHYLFCVILFEKGLVLI